jgi:DNA-binding transcriptional LysR family regulator
MIIFVRVVEMSSFSQAARQLDIPKATVSRRVAELELAQHRCIVVCGQPFAGQTTWQLMDSTGIIETVNVTGILVTNDLMLARQAAITGSGITYLPSSILSEPIANRQLQRVLPNWTFREGTLYMRCFHQFPLPAKVRAFCDFITKKYSEINA